VGFSRKRCPAVTAALDEIVSEFREADKEEKTEFLLDFARKLPPLPERFEALMDDSHRVHECQSPAFLFVELDGDAVEIFGYVPPEAPTARAFVSLLIEGLSGSRVDEVLKVRNDLTERLGLGEVIGMLRMNGINAILNRLRSEVVKAVASRSA
jgi:cysteine desulfuration protein SufE